MLIQNLFAVLVITTLMWLPGSNPVCAQSRSGVENSEHYSSIETDVRFQKFSTATPAFNSSIRIQAGNSAMKVDTYTSVPCVVDWNGDGKKDLLVGCFYNGNVYLFLNSGTNASPVFSTGTKLKADGQEISVVYG